MLILRGSFTKDLDSNGLIQVYLCCWDNHIHLLWFHSLSRYFYKLDIISFLNGSCQSFEMFRQGQLLGLTLQLTLLPSIIQLFSEINVCKWAMIKLPLLGFLWKYRVYVLWNNIAWQWRHNPILMVLGYVWTMCPCMFLNCITLSEHIIILSQNYSNVMFQLHASEQKRYPRQIECKG